MDHMYNAYIYVYIYIYIHIYKLFIYMYMYIFMHIYIGVKKTYFVKYFGIWRLSITLYLHYVILTYMSVLFATLRTLFICLPFSVRYGKKFSSSIVWKILIVQCNLRLYFIYIVSFYLFKLQMLLRCGLTHITIIIPRHIFIGIFVSVFLPRFIYVVSVWSIFHFEPHIHFH